jgi:hypothetical protein
MRIFLIAIAFFACIPLFANDFEHRGDEVISQVKQSQNLKPVELDRGLLKERRAEGDFDYARHKAPENWWDRFTTWVSTTWNNFWRGIFGTPSGEGIGNVFEIIKYAIIALVVGLIIFLFIKLNPGNTVLKEGETGKVFLSEDEQIIKEKDIPDLVENALAENNYRLAMRYSYLLILKELDKYHLIEYEAQKTNTDYLAELKPGSIADHFKTITHLYDFTWYGGFSLKRKRFEKARDEVQKIKNELKNRGNE